MSVSSEGEAHAMSDSDEQGALARDAIPVPSRRFSEPILAHGECE